MTVAVIVATYGDDAWIDAACQHACPSVEREADSVGGEVVRFHDPGGTLASVRNAAAAATDADWIVFVDADDELAGGYLSALYRARQPDRDRCDDCDLLVPAVSYVRPPYGDLSVPRIPNRGRWPVLNECVIGTLVNHAAFEAVSGFREATTDGRPLSLYEDWDLWLRCYDAGARLVYVEDAVYLAHLNPAGRNSGPEAVAVYDSIWVDHLARISA